MKPIRRIAPRLTLVSCAGLLLMSPLALAGVPPAAAAASAPDEASQTCGQAAADPAELQIRYNPASRLVTLTLPETDARGERLAALRPDSFAVYEDGVRAHDLNVEIKRAPLTLGILLEHGGRFATLNEAIDDAVSQADSALVSELRPQDSSAVFTYGARPVQVAGFAAGQAALRDALDKVSTSSPVSETNLYDALVGTLARMQGVHGRKALLLISTGVDTFSQSTYRDALHAARTCGIPIYALDLSATLQQDPTLSLDAAPYSQLDWQRAPAVLAHLTAASGGRVYTPDSPVAFHAIYDDVLERLRARYVITYHSQSTQADSGPRTVRVEVANVGPWSAHKHAGARSRLAIAGTYLPREAAEG